METAKAKGLNKGVMVTVRGTGHSHDWKIGRVIDVLEAKTGDLVLVQVIGERDCYYVPERLTYIRNSEIVY